MRLLALNSGGIDSPVAMHRMLAKGFETPAVIFDSQPFTDEEDVETAVATVERLADLHDTTIETFIVPHGHVQERFLQEADDDEVAYSCLFSRRMMVRAACRIAADNDIRGLLTGENLAQVASQTLDNLVVIDEPADRPIFRPVLGEDKNDVTEEAREIGTFEIPPDGGIVCAATPDHPETHGVRERMNEIEDGFDIEELIEKALEGMERRSIGPSR
jgi:thiamine biosynthesis protein ThiI